MGIRRAAIYNADTWHVDDGVATDGSGRPLRNPVRRYARIRNGQQALPTKRSVH